MLHHLSSSKSTQQNRFECRLNPDLLAAAQLDTGGSIICQISKQQKAKSKKQTANSNQQTANSKKQKSNSNLQTAGQNGLNYAGQQSKRLEPLMIAIKVLNIDDRQKVNQDYHQAAALIRPTGGRAVFSIH